MKIRIIAVGKTKARYLREGEEDFLARVRRYTPCEMTYVREESIGKNASKKDIQKREAQRIVEKIQPSEAVVVLDRKGSQMTSEDFAEFLQRCFASSRSAIDFIIGGPLGLPEDFLPSADLRLSLSQMTFTHEMTRLILLEQIYRALTILRGEKYHK